MATSALDLQNSARPPRTFGVAGILGLLLVVGLYFPTSIGGDFSTALMGVNYALCFAFLVYLAFNSGRVPTVPVCLGILSILPLLLVFTFISGLYTYTFGALVSYAVLCVLFLTDLKTIAFTKRLAHLYAAINIANILICIAILLGNDAVDKFLITHYSMYEPGLVPSMLLLRKPILTFATHSVAGFFLYMFFYMSLQTYKLRNRKLFLVFAVCYWFFLLALLSVSGLLFALLGAVQLFNVWWSASRHRWLWFTLIMVVAIIIMGLGLLDSIVVTGKDVVQSAKVILTSPGNGYLGRLTPGGTMYYDIEYLEQHPFRPVGISYREGLMFGDGGIFEHLLRGSVFLTALIYGGLLLFLRRSLLSKSDVFVMFSVIVAFETGISSLGNFRTIHLLPFFVVYLNWLRSPLRPAEA